MSISGLTSPLTSNLYSSSLNSSGLNSSSANRTPSPTSTALNPLNQVNGNGFGTNNNALGPNAMNAGLNGNSSSAMTQLLSMVMMLLQSLMSGMSAPPVTKQTLAAPAPTDATNAGGTGGSSGAPAGEPSSDGPVDGPSGQDQNAPPQNQTDNSNTTGKNNGDSAGWNKNVSVMTSSDAQHETTDMYSGGKLVGGYLHDLEDGMDGGKNIDQANADAQAKNKEGATSANVNPNSLVKGKGGNALIVTGDGYGNEQDADQLSEKLKKNYGMNVKVLHNASPNQIKSALQDMGQQGGQQAMVAVLAHGAHDDSGQNKGMMAMGKGDGDQWLSEDALKSEVNQYLSPNYGSVNVLLNSCYSGNFAS